MSKSHPDSFRRNPIRRAYKAQADSSKQRGIPFLFTYEEWCRWWFSHLGPHWFKMRGRGRGKYQMARFGDDGPYVDGNVECLFHEDNLRQCEQNGTLLYGEKHGMCKINASVARCIYVADGPKRTIGAIFGVSRYTVSNIKSGSNWARATQGLKKGQTREGKVRVYLPTP